MLNEIDKIKFNSLKSAVVLQTANNQFFQKCTNIQYFQEDFKELFNRYSPSLQDNANLIFLDQNGIKHIKNDVMQTLASFSKTDFMFFISSSFFNRFPFEDHFPHLQNSLDRTKPSNIHREILKYYKTILPKGNSTKLYPFSIKKKGNIYGLIFGSKHCLGVEKFLQIAWKKNAINGEANFDIDEEIKNRQMHFLEPQKLSKLKKFERDLREFILSKEKISNKEILSFTLENGFEPKQASDILRKMKKERIIDHFSYPYIGCKQVYSHENIVHFRRKL